MLVVSVDEDTSKARVVFEYDAGVYTDVFGDCDPLPTGNMLGTWWQTTE